MNIEFLGNASAHAQHFGSFVIAVLGLLYYSKRERPVLVIAFYGINSVLFQFINTYPPHVQGVRVNNIVGNIYVLTETLILLYFFYTLFSASWSKKLIIGLMIAFSILFFVIVNDHWQEFIGLARTLRDLLMICCSVLYFYFLITSMPATQISHYPMFWIVAALFFYFAGTFILSLSIDYLINVLKDDLSYLWPARNFYRFFFCLVVSYGLWLDLRLVKAKSELQR